MSSLQLTDEELNYLIGMHYRLSREFEPREVFLYKSTVANEGGEEEPLTTLKEVTREWHKKRAEEFREQLLLQNAERVKLRHIGYSWWEK